MGPLTDQELADYHHVAAHDCFDCEQCERGRAVLEVVYDLARDWID